MECLSFCVADCIDLTRLDHHYKNTLSGYTITRARDVLKLSPLDAPHHLIFIFKNGTIVSWGLKRHEIDIHLNEISLFTDKPTHFLVHDEFTYRTGEKTTIEPHEYFDVDCLSIQTAQAHDDELKLSFSYGFSQSVKLQYFETMLENLIEKYTPLIKSLSKKEKKSINRSRIRTVIGELILAKSEMNLTSNFLYHPKYFWQHPTLEEDYIMLERYLHLPRRVNALNQRLDTLNDIFDMFNNYLENRHAHILEVIIIILLTMEILFSLLNFHF
ncbi:MAG: RMD1 family protein [Legionellaceae bacterium]|nr:RMD1 family protein [Legionellaceae bacterium]